MVNTLTETDRPPTGMPDGSPPAAAKVSTNWQASLAVITVFSSLSSIADCPDLRLLMPGYHVSFLISALAAIGLALVGCAAPGTGSSLSQGQEAETAEVEFNDP